ncbi:MAG: hypothetical protein JKX82_00075 [Oleispira sp.]|nr:hypothetical protein [Oleispira sp.]
MLTLAAQSIDPKIWLYFALLLGAILIGAIAIFTLRKNLFSNDQQAVNAPGGGLLEHLDEMKRTGQITKEEYEATRATIIENASRQLHESVSKPETPQTDL